MLEILLLFLLIPLAYALLPLKLARAKRSDALLTPPKLYLYSFAFHIHTQFSYDSLGKPEDVFRARDQEGIDYVVITDHEVEHFKHFADERTIVGREEKINDEGGRLLGNVIRLGELSVITHHFKRKYRWRLRREPSYIFELLNLKDALLENKKALALYILAFPLLWLILRDRYIKGILKLVDPERYARRYLSEGWENKLLSGLDHHVKVYIREVGIRFLFPSYRFSFSLLRNYVLSQKPVKNKKELLDAIKSERLVSVFGNKPVLYWNEGKTIYVYSPFPNTLVKVISKDKTLNFFGSNIKTALSGGNYIICGYTYLFRLGPLFFGVKPLFFSDLIIMKEEGDEDKAHRQGRSYSR